MAILVIKHPDLAKIIIEYYHQTPLFNLSGKLKGKKRPSSKSSIFDDDDARSGILKKRNLFLRLTEKKMCVCH